MKRTIKKNPAEAEPARQLALHVDTVIHQTPFWASHAGDQDDIILSTRIRLARNLAGIPFPTIARREELDTVVERIGNACKSIRMLQPALTVDIRQCKTLISKALVERRLISPVFAESSSAGIAVIDESEQLSIMVNEEDHLRLQSIQPGLSLQEAWRQISRLDDELSEQVEYAFSDKFGYLTACPTNTGTGMRASILIHLPALSILEQVDQAIKELAPSELAIRGFYGEGTDIIGNIYQVSNQLTLGRTEAAIISRLEVIAYKFLDLERNAREKLLHIHRVRLEDEIFRALGILQAARVLSSAELMKHLSMVRLGNELNLIQEIDHRILNELMIFTQPAHLQLLHENITDPESRDVLRARLVREKLAG